MGYKKEWPARRRVRDEPPLTTGSAAGLSLGVTCATCTGVIETLDSTYCMSCRLHWSNYDDNSEDY